MNNQTALVKHAAFLQRDLQTLELGQFGISTDECRAFVGLPATVVPASLVAGRTKTTVPGSAGENIELLTEFTPPSVLSRALYRPIVITAPVGATEFAIVSASRALIDYMAYPTLYNNGGDPLYTGTDISVEFESGTVNIMSMSSSKTLYTQTNSSNHLDGLPLLKFHAPKFDPTTGRLTFTIVNTSTYQYSVELLIRCWNGEVIQEVTIP